MFVNLTKNCSSLTSLIIKPSILLTSLIAIITIQKPLPCQHRRRAVRCRRDAPALPPPLCRRRHRAAAANTALQTPLPRCLPLPRCCRAATTAATLPHCRHRPAAPLSAAVAAAAAAAANATAALLPRCFCVRCHRAADAAIALPTPLPCCRRQHRSIAACRPAARRR